LLAYDALRFLKEFQVPIRVNATAARSVVHFSPTDTRIHGIYSGNPGNPAHVIVGTSALWSASQYTLEGHTSSVHAVAFSPDGALIISGSADRTIRVWDVRTGTFIGEALTGHVDDVLSVAFSPDGTQLASGSYDRTIRLWDTKNRSPIGEPFKGHLLPVNSVTFSPKGNVVLSCSLDKTFILWDKTTGSPVSYAFRRLNFSPTHAVFSPDGNMILLSGLDSVQLWDANIGLKIGDARGGHSRGVNSVAFSPDGSLFVSGDSNGAICLWDTRTSRMIGKFQEESIVYSLAFSPDGSRVASGSRSNNICQWDVKTGELVGNPLRGHFSDVKSVAFSPDGLQIASGSADRTIRLWDARVVPSPKHSLTDERITRRKGLVGATIFTLSPDAAQVATGSVTGRIYFWHVNTGNAVRKTERVNPSKPIFNLVALAYSPDGCKLIASSNSQGLRLFDVTTGKLIGKPWQVVGNFGACSVLFSAGGTRLISGLYSGGIWVWDVTTGKPVVKRKAPENGGIGTIALSPDGTLLATGSQSDQLDGVPRLWDVEKARPIGGPLEGHRWYTYSLTFSRDGTRLISGSENLVLVHDVATHQQINFFSDDVSSSLLLDIRTGWVTALGHCKPWWVPAANRGAFALTPDGIMCCCARDGQLMIVDGRKLVAEFVNWIKRQEG
jgi:WD40 repeat protein